MGLFAMVTGLVEQPTSAFMATQTTVFPKSTQGGQFAALRYGQFGAPRLVNFKRYSMVSLSVFSNVTVKE